MVEIQLRLNIAGKIFLADALSLRDERNGHIMRQNTAHKCRRPTRVCAGKCFPAI